MACALNVTVAKLRLKHRENTPNFYEGILVGQYRSTPSIVCLPDTSVSTESFLLLYIVLQFVEGYRKHGRRQNDFVK